MDEITARPDPNKTYIRPSVSSLSEDENLFASIKRRGRKKHTHAPGYTNINKSITPWNETDGCINVRDAIMLSRKAHEGVAIYNQTIEVQVEFSNSSFYFEGGNADSREFFKNWDKKIGGWNLREQFFREYYVSSNIFYYRVDKELNFTDLGRRRLLRLDNKVPIKYVLLDPAQIHCDNALNFVDAEYYQFLNDYQIKRLKNPKTEAEKEFKESLPAETQAEINKGISPVKIKLDPEKTYAIFVKKQDYQGLSVPMYYSVLADIDLKLEFKKMEKTVAKFADYLILLVNLGSPDEPADDYIIQYMNGIFAQKSVAKVLVADHNTKMNFIVPELNKILGPEKYEIVNKDIADGLMNIFFKEENYSNSSVKIQVFVERLKEAQKSFLEMFYKPEMERIGKALGFKSIPEPKFAEIDITDKIEYLKLYNRLYELGMLTPQEAVEAWQTGKLPTTEESLEHQKEFKKQRDDGLFQPLSGAKTSGAENGGGRDSGTKVKDQSKKPIGASYSMALLKDVFIEANKIFSEAQELYKQKHKIKRLSKAKKQQVLALTEILYINEPADAWQEKVKEYINSDLPPMENPSDEIISIAQEHNLDYAHAAFLSQAKCELLQAEAPELPVSTRKT